MTLPSQNRPYIHQDEAEDKSCNTFSQSNFTHTAPTLADRRFPSHPAPNVFHQSLALWFGNKHASWENCRKRDSP